MVAPGSGYVDIDKFLPVYAELIRRIGQTAMARRLGMAVDSLNIRRIREKKTVRATTYHAAADLLEVVRANGEDGWDTAAVRIANLRPHEAARKSAENRRLRRLKREEKARRKELRRIEEQRRAEIAYRERESDRRALLFSMAMDKDYSDRAWAYPDKDGLLMKFADFECKHGRLPGDLTPACGCWAGEV